MQLRPLGWIAHTTEMCINTILIPSTKLNISILILMYHTVKNFGGQKVWRKGLLQRIGGKNFGEKACVLSVQSIRNKCRTTFWTCIKMHRK